MFVAVDTEQGAAYGPFSSDEKTTEFVLALLRHDGEISEDDPEFYDGKTYSWDELSNHGWFVFEVTYIEEDDMQTALEVASRVRSELASEPGPAPAPALAPEITFRKTFGPGRLESVEVVGYSDGSKAVRGTYMVYCGYGNEHTCTLGGSEMPREEWERIIVTRVNVNPFIDQDEALASEVIDDELTESWNDPCAAAEPELN